MGLKDKVRQDPQGPSETPGNQEGDNQMLIVKGEGPGPSLGRPFSHLVVLPLALPSCTQMTGAVVIALLAGPWLVPVQQAEGLVEVLAQLLCVVIAIGASHV